MMNP